MSHPRTPPETESLHWRLLTTRLDIRQRWSRLCDEAVRREADRAAPGTPKDAAGSEQTAIALRTDPTSRWYRESAAGTHPRTPDDHPGPAPGVFSDPDFLRPERPRDGR